MHLSLIDTDVLSEILKNRDQIVARNAARYISEVAQFAISAMSRYEVIRGLKHKSAHRQLARFATFCEHAVVYPITNEILDRTSDLRVDARRNGLPCRDPDLVIAATALEHGRALVTGNVDHFSWIPGLTIDNWRLPQSADD
jgi:tRNA(fMet)-specific endonuclease VapC